MNIFLGAVTGATHIRSTRGGREGGRARGGMAATYSPTPHRIALCALARYLDDADDDDDDDDDDARDGDGEKDARRRRRTRLGPSDRRALARALMRACEDASDLLEPDLRTFKRSLDAESRASGAPPPSSSSSRPAPLGRKKTKRAMRAAKRANLADSDGDVDMDTSDVDISDGVSDDDVSDDDDDDAGTSAPGRASSSSSRRRNLKDVLTEAVDGVRDVDALVALFRDVAPRSSHEASMRGLSADEAAYDETWGMKRVDAESAIGVFLRRVLYKSFSPIARFQHLIASPFN